MALKYIKDRYGKFKGSVSDGKNIPNSVPALPKKPELTVEQQTAPFTNDDSAFIRPLSIPRQIQLKYNISEFFEHEVVENAALRQSILEGKEIGHTISSDIDTKTSQVLKDAGHPIVYEVDQKTNAKKARSFGDIWIRDGNYVNPINVKTGVVSSDSYGNSNMVSMSRLKDAYLSNEISAYYLAIVKFDVSEDETITPQVFFVDALNFVDHLNYNMGTGQIMMKEKELYTAIEENPTKTLTREEKITKLKGLYQSGLDEAKAKLTRMEAGALDFDSVLEGEDYSSARKTARHFL